MKRKKIGSSGRSGGSSRAKAKPSKRVKVECAEAVKEEVVDDLLGDDDVTVVKVSSKTLKARQKCVQQIADSETVVLETRNYMMNVQSDTGIQLATMKSFEALRNKLAFRLNNASLMLSPAIATEVSETDVEHDA